MSSTPAQVKGLLDSLTGLEREIKLALKPKLDMIGILEPKSEIAVPGGIRRKANI